MDHVLDQDFLPEKYFEEICCYPHGSGHEKPLSDYLVRFAQQHGLRYKQYPNWNVIIYKPASAGYEDHAPVMLQAHIDMVCEKEPGSDHNFETDPISIYVENGILRADGTTLGADDGVGVAYMLSFLEDDSIPHPPLECVFTVQEEVGLIGSKELAFEDITAKRMIGLDDMGGSTCYISSCGSQYMTTHKDFEFSHCDGSGFRIEVSGLSGGHSGVSISKEKGNAIKLVSRVLLELSKQYPLRIVSIDGGGKDNIIPASCTAVFVCDASYKDLNKAVLMIEQTFQTELEFSDSDVSLTLAAQNVDWVLSRKDSEELITYLFLLPNGFRHKSMKITDLTTASENLANIKTDNSGLTIRYLVRSELDSRLEEMADEIILLGGIFGFETVLGNHSPGWKYEEHSDVREKLFAAYRKVTGGEMKPLAEHGGLETSFISGGILGIDIATCGPLCEGYHTPKECLDLHSFRIIYEVLKETLRSM